MQILPVCVKRKMRVLQSSVLIPFPFHSFLPFLLFFFQFDRARKKRIKNGRSNCETFFARMCFKKAGRVQARACFSSRGQAIPAFLIAALLGGGDRGGGGVVN